MKDREEGFIKKTRIKKSKEPITLARDGYRWWITKLLDGRYEATFFDPASTQSEYFDNLTDAIIRVIKQSIYMKWYK